MTNLQSKVIKSRQYHKLSKKVKEKTKNMFEGKRTEANSFLHNSKEFGQFLDETFNFV